MSAWWLAIGSVFTLLSGYFLKLYNLFVINIRLDNTLAYRLIDSLNKPKYKKWLFSEDMESGEDINPKTISFLLLHNPPFLFSCSERLLQAGWSGKEIIGSVTTLRFFRKQVKEFIRTITKRDKESPSIYIYLCGWYQKIGLVPIEKPILKPSIQDQINEVINICLISNNKRGILLHGPPGNGKSSIVKYLASQLEANIYIPLIQKDITDADLINMFRSIENKRRSIIVLEDFDNYFHNRESIYKTESKLNFATLLNILDGLYCDMTNQLIIMTVNDINKVDPALKYRPSRFDISLHIDNPSVEERKIIFNHYGQNGYADRLADMTHDKSAAIVCEIAKQKYNDSCLNSKVNRILESFAEVVNE